MHIIEQPVPDFELGVPRRPVRFELQLPSAGLRPDTGLVFYIHGWGGRYNDAYTAKLLPYLADTHNCVAVAVDYQGAIANGGCKIFPAPNFFQKLAEHHGVEVTASADMDPQTVAMLVMEQLAAQGVEELHQECMFMRGPEGYSNFGLLPALDHLQVLHRVLSELPLDKRRIYMIGTSYGGYVAMLAAKLAPNSFRLVIDNAGFSGPNECVAIYGFGRLVNLRPKACVAAQLAFSPDPDSPKYLTPSMQSIRTLGVAGHYDGIDGTCTSYSYHSVDDTVAKLTEKVAASEVLSRYRRHTLRIITEADIDGRIFKDTSHGMHASMRGLFDMTMERWRGDGGADEVVPETDFDLETVNILPCGEKDYIVTCSEAGVSLSVIKGRRAG